MSHKNPEPQPIDVSSAELEALIERAAQLMPEGDAKLIRSMADTLVLLSQSVDDKAASLRRLMKMVFGQQSEKASEVLSDIPPDGEDVESSEDEPDKEDDSDLSREDNESHSDGDELNNDDTTSSRSGGKRGSDACTGAKTIQCKCNEVSRGDICPRCKRGKVYPVKPRVQLRFTADAPIAATKFERETLRCNTCGVYFVADLPEDIDEERYDEKSVAMMALLHYGTGMPFNRLDKLQEAIGVPLPASTQWDIVSAGAQAFFCHHGNVAGACSTGKTVPQ